jgi:hypothetical protein
MTSIGKLALALVVAGGLAAPAFAASDNSAANGGADQDMTGGPSKMHNGANDNTADQAANPGSGNADTSDQAAMPGMHMAQRLRNDLSKAGYTDITVSPSGFMVRGKDSQGNPVMMMISPDSVAAITEQNAASNATHTNQNATGATDDGNMQPAQPNETKP